MDLDYFLTNTSSPWMDADGEDSDIVMTTRIRLARNFADYRFPLSYSDQEANAVEEQMLHALLSTSHEHPNFSHFSIKDLPILQRQVLMEKHLISQELAKKSRNGAVFLSEDETLSVLVNEEDHIRIQCLAAGQQLRQAYERAKQLDSFIGNQIQYAYHERFGYLTTCPTNVGTGLRASVMMHLPALTKTNKMSFIIQMMTRLGMAVRGIYGEGSGNLGDVYQISNQITLGKSEQEILDELNQVVEKILLKERLARKQLLEQASVVVEDSVSRAFGTIQYAKILSSEEAASCISNIRLGVSLGVLPTISYQLLNECLLFIQPGFIQQYAGATLEPTERDIYRAKYIQEQFAKCMKKSLLNIQDKGEESHDV